MNRPVFKKYFFFFLVFFLISVIFWKVGGTQIRYKQVASKEMLPEGLLPEIKTGVEIRQEFVVQTDTLEKITFQISTLEHANVGNLTIYLLDLNTNKIVEKKEINTELLESASKYEWVLENSVLNAKGNPFAFIIESTCLSGQAPALFYSNLNIEAPSCLYIDEILQDFSICYQYVGKHYFILGQYYWFIISALFILLIFYSSWVRKRERAGKFTVLGLAISVWKNYQFLIKQLVARDFKTKYKRSVLGYLWSFLNPLLTMSVQYIVFSTLFKSDINNFPVYLLTGIILFNFFVDAVGQGLISIVANAALITKVYVPKYIYPSTKVISCAANLLISIIPLLLVAILTGTKLTSALILFPFVLSCLLIFCIGMSLCLSSAMVFFRDTQYLWGIVSLIWTYATPLFYPESIIPEQFRIILKLNPMYYFIKFARTILIEGVSPEPIMYIYCIVPAAISLLIGAIVFKKSQDKFILYI